MYKQDPHDLQDIPGPASVDKRIFQEVDNLLVDTNTGDLDNFHLVSYDIKPIDPNTKILHEAIQVPYIEYCIDPMEYYIDDLQNNKTWSTVPQYFFPKAKWVAKSEWVFNIKSLPYGTMINFKAIFCVRVDTQIAGVN